jgi:A118 family predicted phage portal protein
MARFWWGRPTGDLTQVHDQTHVPLAADMARTSADLLFSDPPTFTVKDQATQKRIDEAVGDRTYATLAGAAEAGAALGGVYLRVAWDQDVDDAAFLTVVNADVACPEFSWGRLRAVTFWHVIKDNGSTVLRHLERHELDGNGIGLIQHGLYQGTPTHLGRVIPLAEHPATEGLAGGIDSEGYITSGRTPGLNVVYIPNCEPSVAKAFMGLPAAAGWGSSDLDGVEPMLDNLDEIYSSWMRDIRLGKARILLARYMLDDLGAGMGAAFDADREIFSPLKMAAAEEGDAPITTVQFGIRFAEHQASADEWTAKIIRSAGYSLQTFGEAGDVAMTATEVTAKESRSLGTRDRKIRAWRPALVQSMGKLLSVDASVFGKGVNLDELAVAFTDGSQDSPLALAQTALALFTAQAASTHTLVAMTHPDWDDTKVKAEVALIVGEQPAPAPDPFAIGA